MFDEVILLVKIRIYGLGGQGVVTMGKVLCTAFSIYEHQYAKTMPAYGHERKGGAVLTDVIADDERILTNSFITKPDYVIVLAPNAKAEEIKLDLSDSQNAVLLINTDEVRQEYAANFADCYFVDATAYSMAELGRNLPNIGMMAALVKTGVLSLEAVKNAVNDHFEKNAEAYNKVIMEAYNGTKRK